MAEETLQEDSAFQRTTATVLPDNSTGAIGADDVRNMYATLRDRDKLKAIFYSSSASLTIDLSAAPVQLVELTQNIGSVSFVNTPPFNLLGASEDATHAVWTAAANTFVSASNVANIDGLSVADRYTVAATTGTGLRQELWTVAGAVYQFSVDARTVSAASPATFDIGFSNNSTSSINLGAAQNCSASSSWGVYDVVYTAATTTFIYPMIDNRTNTVATDIYISRLRCTASTKTDYVKTNPYPTGEVAQVQLYLQQKSGGSNTVSWGPRVLWENSATPTLSTTADTVDSVTLISTDGGAIWRATFNGQGWGG
jgi:hypothetical protein